VRDYAPCIFDDEQRSFALDVESRFFFFFRSLMA